MREIFPTIKIILTLFDSLVFWPSTFIGDTIFKTTFSSINASVSTSLGLLALSTMPAVASAAALSFGLLERGWLVSIVNLSGIMDGSDAIGKITNGLLGASFPNNASVVELSDVSGYDFQTLSSCVMTIGSSGCPGNTGCMTSSEILVSSWTNSSSVHASTALQDKAIELATNVCNNPEIYSPSAMDFLKFGILPAAAICVGLGVYGYFKCRKIDAEQQAGRQPQADVEVAGYVPLK